jgi:hypothetical protein
MRARVAVLEVVRRLASSAVPRCARCASTDELNARQGCLPLSSRMRCTATDTSCMHAFAS